MSEVMRGTYLKEVQARFNEPILLSDRLARIIGYGEDKQDCYIICQTTRRDWTEQGQIVWHTMVGGYVYLSAMKKHKKEYERLQLILTYNGCPEQKEFRVVIEDADMFEGSLTDEEEDFK